MADLFLVGGRLDGDDVAIHDVVEFVLRVGEDEVIEVDGADEFALAVADEDRVDGLRVFPAFADGLHRRFDGEGADQFDVVGGHQGPGGPILIFQ